MDDDDDANKKNDDDDALIIILYLLLHPLKVYYIQLPTKTVYSECCVVK